MMTFMDQYQLAQQISGVTDATNTTIFKRSINMGGTRFMSVLGRPFNRESRFTNLVASQQYYQTAADMLRVSDVVVNTGNTWRPLNEIVDENLWRLMNQTVITGIPIHYFIRGSQEIGLYPSPSQSITNGIELVFEPKNTALSLDDFATGTVTVSNGSTTITHSAGGFTAAMVGRYFTVTDGTDGNWYQVSAYIDTNNLTLGNYYQGVSGAAKAFRIGPVMYIPEEFHEAPVDYAMYRYYLQRTDAATAAEFKGLFEGALSLAQDLYGDSSSNQIVTSDSTIRIYNPLQDTPPSIGP